jgi:hypothetical protein
MSAWEEQERLWRRWEARLDAARLRRCLDLAGRRGLALAASRVVRAMRAYQAHADAMRTATNDAWYVSAQRVRDRLSDEVFAARRALARSVRARRASK